MARRRPLGLEHHHEPLLPKNEFLRRQLQFMGFALFIVIGSLGIGVLGYHVTENMPWLDALLNASMILFGMGPVNPVQSSAGKWFASLYAMFSGVAFITIVGVTFAPLFHRFLHRFHLDVADEEEKTRRS